MTNSSHASKQGAMRKRILEAAESVFLEKGFHAANMTEIARQAKISPPHIYNFYDNKASLAMAVQEKMNDETFRILEEVMSKKEKGVLPCVENVFDTRRTALMLTLFTEGTRNESLRKKIKESGEKFQALLKKVHDIDDNDSERLIRLQLAMNMFLGTSISRLFNDEVDKSKMIEGLFRITEMLTKK